MAVIHIKSTIVTSEMNWDLPWTFQGEWRTFQATAGFHQSLWAAARISYGGLKMVMSTKPEKCWENFQGWPWPKANNFWPGLQDCSCPLTMCHNSTGWGGINLSATCTPTWWVQIEHDPNTMGLFDLQLGPFVFAIPCVGGSFGKEARRIRMETSSYR